MSDKRIELLARASVYRPGEDLRHRHNAALLGIIERGELAVIASQYDPTANSTFSKRKLERIIEHGRLIARAKTYRAIMKRSDAAYARMSDASLRQYIAEAQAKMLSPEYLQQQARQQERARLFAEYARLYGAPANARTSTARLIEKIQERSALPTPAAAPAVGPIEYKLAKEDRFRGFRAYMFSLANVDTLAKLWEAFRAIAAERNIWREQPHLTVTFNSASDLPRNVTIRNQFLHTLDDFKERMRSIVNDDSAVSGSDPIDLNEYKIDYGELKITYHTLVGRGAAEFVFAKIRPNPSGDKKESTMGCLYRAVETKLNEVSSGLVQLFNHHAQRLGLTYGEDREERFEEVLNGFGFSLQIYCDFPDDYATAPLMFKVIGDKRLRQIPYKALKLTKQAKYDKANDKQYQAVEIVYGACHFEPYYGVLDRPVYEDNPKNLYYEKDNKLVKVSRAKVAESAKLNMGKFEQRVVVYDLETVFSNLDNAKLRPYSNAWCYKHGGIDAEERIADDSQAGAYIVSMNFGDECLGDFFDKLLKDQKDKMYCLAGYNSSRFDNIFTIPELLRRDALTDVFYQNNSVLNIKWGGRHTTFDICRFTMAPLKKACQDFATKFRKMGDFDHVEIQRHFNEHGELHSFFHEPGCTNRDRQIKELQVTEPDDLDMHAKAGKFGCHCERFVKLCKYNMLDVLSTHEIYEKLEEFLYEVKIISHEKNERAFDRKTIGSAIYRMFEEDARKCGGDEPAKLAKLEYDDYKAIRGGLFAGRTQCYGGPKCDLSGGNQYRMLDVKSLYPYVMLNREYPCGEAKHMRATECFAQGLIGFFKCTFSQEKLRVKVIPRRTAGEPLDWNYDGQITAVLSTVDIKCLNKAGATFHGPIEDGIAFTHKIDGDQLFKCMTSFKKVKEDEDAKPKNERNNVKRNMAKLFLNSLSGKVNEMLHIDKTVLVRTQADMDRAIENSANHKDMVLNEVLSRTVGIISYTCDPKEVYAEQYRPVYLGVLIYAYARDHMYRSILAEYDVLYQDTDSALVTKVTYDKFAADKPELLGEEFGQLALEEGSEDMAKFMTIAPKNYFIMGTDDKLIKKGFKGVRLTSDKYIDDPAALMDVLQVGRHDDWSVKPGCAFDLYHGDRLKTVAQDHGRFMQKIKANGRAYVLCSSLRKCMRTVERTGKEAGMIYQEFTLKEIRAHQIADV
jgi:hypothetical protein